MKEFRVAYHPQIFEKPFIVESRKTWFNLGWTPWGNWSPVLLFDEKNNHIGFAAFPQQDLAVQFMNRMLKDQRIAAESKPTEKL